MDPIAVRLHHIEQTMEDLKDWSARHEDGHNAQTRLLATTIESLTVHTENHHGKASQLRQGGILTTIVALLMALSELARRFLLP